MYTYIHIYIYIDIYSKCCSPGGAVCGGRQACPRRFHAYPVISCIIIVGTMTSNNISTITHITILLLLLLVVVLFFIIVITRSAGGSRPYPGASTCSSRRAHCGPGTCPGSQPRSPGRIIAIVIELIGPVI